MHIIYLDKKITLDSIVSDINLINIDENINYLKRLDGILIKGYLDLSCQYISLGIIKEFKDKIEINKLVAYENIYSNNINMKLLDFDYFIKEKEIIFSFKMDIEGYKDVDKTFQDQTEEMEIVSNVDVEINDIKELITNNEDIIVLDDLPLIETEVKEVIEEKIEKNICEDINKEGESIDFNINGSSVTSNKKESIFDSIFKKERKVKMYKYRVILENDTYEEIAKEYNINLFKLKEINNNITLSLGNIIKIPCKK